MSQHNRIFCFRSAGLAVILFLAVLTGVLPFAAQAKRVKANKLPPFQKFLTRFPEVFCQQSDACENAFFLTGADCKGYLSRQISKKYENKKFRVSHHKVDACLMSLSAATCDELKTKTPDECAFLNKL